MDLEHASLKLRHIHFVQELRPSTQGSVSLAVSQDTWEEETAALAKAVGPYIRMSRLGEPYAHAFSGKQGERSTYNS